MAVDLGPAFPPNFGGVPPHVAREDLNLWERFRRVGLAGYVRLYFDVALGEGGDVPAGTPENVAGAWRRLTRFRADVVAERPDGWDIIELRQQAGPGAIGALQTYTSLWLTGPPDGRPVRAILVSDVVSPDIAMVARLAGIETRQV